MLSLHYTNRPLACSAMFKGDELAVADSHGMIAISGVGNRQMIWIVLPEGPDVHSSSIKNSRTVDGLRLWTVSVKHLPPYGSR